MIEEMYDQDGFKNIYAIDLSEVCIKQMEARNSIPGKERKELMFI